MIGIYKIQNIVNGKIYIGQSRNIENRFQQHYTNKSHNLHLTNAINKYTINNFVFTIEKEIDILNQDEIDYWEKYYINKYQSHLDTKGYNKTLGGKNGNYIQQSKKLISNQLKGKKSLNRSISKLGAKNPMYGKKRSNEAIEKARVKMKNHYVSNETREKIRKANMNRSNGEKSKLSKKIMCIETKIIYGSIREAGRMMNITYQNIQKALKNNGRCKGYTFMLK